MTMKTVARIQYTRASIPDAGTPSELDAFFLVFTDEEQTVMPTNPPNEGEGNKTADRNYREATKKFVESDRGREQIERAGDVDENEERDIERAEEEAKRHAKEHDPQEVRDSRKRTP